MHLDCSYHDNKGTSVFLFSLTKQQTTLMTFNEDISD